MLLVGSSGNLGGGERNLLDIAVHLKSKGSEIFVILPSQGHLLDVIDKKNISVSLIDMPSYPNPKSVFQTRKILRTYHPDIIHAHGTKAALFARLSSIGLSIPVVYTLHGIHYLYYPNLLKKWLYICGERFLKRFTAWFICVCKDNFEKAKKARVIDPMRTNVIYNGVDMPSTVSAEEARKEFDVDGEIVVLNIAALKEVKGQLFLIEAAKAISKSSEKVKFWIVGEGEKKSYLSEKIRTEDLEQKFNLFGFQKDISKILLTADIFVLPSLHEAFPYTILEAMAHQKPVVATEVGGVPEAVLDGVTGFLVSPADAGALSERISYLIEHPELRKKMGEAGAQRVAENFNLKLMLEEHDRLYSSLLARKSRQSED